MDISAIGRQFGLDEAQTRAAFEALAPVVASGIRRNGATPGGLQDIFKSVLTKGQPGILDDENAVSFDRAKPAGDEILGQLFGDKEVSRGVAQQLSATSGIGAAILKKLLPVVASVVMGQVAKKMGGGVGNGGGGGLGDILGDILGGGQASGQSAPPPQQKGNGGLGDILKDILGGGQAAPQGDSQAQPPRPTQNGKRGDNPLEDMLNDILTGGKGGVVVKQIPQDQMGEILKDIFGGKLPGGNSSDGQLPDATMRRGRKTLDDVTGGGTPSGDAADILLDSVGKSLRR